MATPIKQLVNEVLAPFKGQNFVPDEVVAAVWKSLHACKTFCGTDCEKCTEIRSALEQVLTMSHYTTRQ